MVLTTKRTNRRKYIPISIESQQPNGEWWTRNTLKVENDKAKGGDISRDELIAMAHKLMVLWNCNSDYPISLRVGGVKRPNLIAEILRVAKEPPEASFDNVEDMLAYLNLKEKPDVE